VGGDLQINSVLLLRLSPNLGRVQVRLSWVGAPGRDLATYARVPKLATYARVPKLESDGLPRGLS